MNLQIKRYKQFFLVDSVAHCVKAAQAGHRFFIWHDTIHLVIPAEDPELFKTVQLDQNTARVTTSVWRGTLKDYFYCYVDAKSSIEPFYGEITVEA